MKDEVPSAEGGSFSCCGVQGNQDGLEQVRHFRPVGRQVVFAARSVRTGNVVEYHYGWPVSSSLSSS